MNVKMNSRIIIENHAVDPEIRFFTKSISKPNGRETAMPITWELTRVRFSVFAIKILGSEIFTSGSQKFFFSIEDFFYGSIITEIFYDGM